MLGCLSAVTYELMVSVSVVRATCASQGLNEADATVYMHSPFTAGALPLHARHPV